MTLAVLGLSGGALARGGWPTLLEGLWISGETFLKIIPLLIAAFTLAGLISEMLSEQSVNKWLGGASGFKGIVLACIAGAIVPGGPYIFYPLAATFLLSGARLGTVIAFLTAKNLWTLSRLPMEFALMDTKIVVIRYVVTFIFPVLLGLLANFLFSGYTQGLKESIPQIQDSSPSDKENNQC